MLKARKIGVSIEIKAKMMYNFKSKKLLEEHQYARNQ